MCFNSKSNADCTCGNANFPGNWQSPTCAAEASTLPPTTTTATTTMATTPTVVSAEAWEHFVLLNAIRATGFTCPQGMAFAPNNKALQFDCRLWKASYLHSRDMAENNYFSHVSLDGREPWDRAIEQDTSAYAENIAAGSGSAQGTLDQFKASDAHCRNMLSPQYEVAGVGYAAGGQHRHYWTQMFSFAGEVDRSCYPAVALAQAKGDDYHAHEGQRVIGEGWARKAAAEGTGGASTR